MRYQQLNHNWNADPNAPSPHLTVSGQIVQLEFYLNAFQFEQFQEGDKACLAFRNCHKYSFTSLNDEGYYNGQHRYKNHQLPWGYFYELLTDWEVDFPQGAFILERAAGSTQLHHFIFFLRDMTFECVAESWNIQCM
ncbi:hypothetical protein ACFPAF_18625 [Hymenobacter endophyticus]|uniref:Uncharacterized protein n=1 Tax=Hymenobacter endophyticus TaxID=3076335 RepID=A0ABU3TM49_9BACT|nr:hypothetical protein [Hymenobacter endophyticus]MDU0372423.1 hypothetical protein [Hymenobacter endophyticus]